MRLRFGKAEDDGRRRLYLNDYLIGYTTARHGIVAFRALGESEWIRFVGMGELRRYVTTVFYTFI